MKESEQILFNALWEIACGQEINSREDMINLTADTLCNWLKTNGKNFFPKNKRPIPLKFRCANPDLYLNALGETDIMTCGKCHECKNEEKKKYRLTENHIELD